MAFKIAEAYVEVKAELSSLRASLSRTGPVGSLLVKAGGTLGRAFGRVFSAAAAAAIRIAKWAFAGLVGAMTAAVAAANRQEQADIKLAESLRSIGKYSDEAMRDLKAFAAGIQDTTTYGDEAIQGIMAFGASLADLSGVKLKEATKMAIGLAEVLRIDVNSAMQLVARAAKGQYQLFSRYGVVLADARNDQEKWNRILALSARGLQIQEERAKTFQGRVLQLKNRIGDLGEKIGALLLPRLTEAATAMGAWVKANEALITQKFSQWVDSASAAFATIPRWWEAEGRAMFESIISDIQAFIGVVQGLRGLLPKIPEEPPPISAEEQMRNRKKEIEDLMKLKRAQEEVSRTRREMLVAGPTVSDLMTAARRYDEAVIAYAEITRGLPLGTEAIRIAYHTQMKDFLTEWVNITNTLKGMTELQAKEAVATFGKQLKEEARLRDMAYTEEESRRMAAWESELEGEKKLGKKIFEERWVVEWKTWIMRKKFALWYQGLLNRLYPRKAPEAPQEMMPIGTYYARLQERGKVPVGQAFRGAAAPARVVEAKDPTTHQLLRDIYKAVSIGTAPLRFLSPVPILLPEF